MPHVTVMPEREAEEVLADRQVSSTPDNKPHMESLVKWKNLPIAEASWSNTRGEEGPSEGLLE